MMVGSQPWWASTGSLLSPFLDAIRRVLRRDGQALGGQDGICRLLDLVI